MRQTQPDTHTPLSDPPADPPPGAASGPGPSAPGAVAEAACGYWRRRGLPTAPDQVVAAPTAPLLLLALLAATGGEGGGGGVVLPRPGAAWHAAQARLLDRPVHPVPVPAECGGVPDPFALLETVGRARADGGDPRVLVLSVADDLTGTAAPPELLHEVCEAAAQEGLLVVSDESLRDASHDPRHDTVVVSPAEILHRTGPLADGGVGGGTGGGASGTPGDSAVVLVDLGADPEYAPASGVRAGVARLPATGRGQALGEGMRAALAALRARLDGPAAAAAAEVLGEPRWLRDRRAAVNRARGTLATALHHALTGVGAVCRPPHAGRHLYPDFEALRPGLAARGIVDAPRLEAELVRRLGPYALGGHRFGDDPRALRVRLSTDVLTRGVSPGAASVTAPSDSAAPPGPDAPPVAPVPVEQPDTTGTLTEVTSALTELTAG